jgi:hypothetical protein
MKDLMPHRRVMEDAAKALRVADVMKDLMPHRRVMEDATKALRLSDVFADVAHQHPFESVFKQRAPLVKRGYTNQDVVLLFIRVRDIDLRRGALYFECTERSYELIEVLLGMRIRDKNSFKDFINSWYQLLCEGVRDKKLVEIAKEEGIGRILHTLRNWYFHDPEVYCSRMTYERRERAVKGIFRSLIGKDWPSSSQDYEMASEKLTVKIEHFLRVVMEEYTAS